MKLNSSPHIGHIYPTGLKTLDISICVLYATAPDQHSYIISGPVQLSSLIGIKFWPLQQQLLRNYFVRIPLHSSLVPPHYLHWLPRGSQDLLQFIMGNHLLPGGKWRVILQKWLSLTPSTVADIKKELTLLLYREKFEMDLSGGTNIKSFYLKCWMFINGALTLPEKKSSILQHLDYCHIKKADTHLQIKYPRQLESSSVAFRGH